jgi:hypothetical protein
VILWFIGSYILSNILIEGFYEDTLEDKVEGLKY